MNIKATVTKLIKSYPDLVLPENHNRMIRIIWADNKLIRAESILRATRSAVAELKAAK